jgi:excisionase family DNA binding protein
MAAETQTSDVMSIEEAGARLRLGRQLCYELARQGKLPGCFRLGNRWIVSRVAFERALAQPETIAK